ncbi:basic region leucine zipper [Colletotrichum scovillei]|uniref:Basic region leucine zipper n=1 Tax=Colletotrichum scovillei TaxID=1209932 RepID=A0A9P7QSZ1_9PEZI|nr:basic region leucine zipper [Colletotrichum scovillei]KAG7040980.1 basic region leucine zipper [Colletotrichum scovillei]KAG7061013.1 basic region leucine zipper [Colletotrichum scovillei]
MKSVLCKLSLLCSKVDLVLFRLLSASFGGSSILDAIWSLLAWLGIAGTLARHSIVPLPNNFHCWNISTSASEIGFPRVAAILESCKVSPWVEAIAGVVRMPRAHRVVHLAADLRPNCWTVAHTLR